MFGMPRVDRETRPTNKQFEGANVGRCWSLNRAHSGQTCLACRDPVVDEPWVRQQERSHPEAGGVSNSESPPKRRIEPHGVRRGCGRHVLHEVHDEGANQVDREHLCLKGCQQLRAVGDRLTVCGAELAGAVHGGGSHQVPDLFDGLGIGLVTGRKSLDHGGPKTDGSIRSRQGELALGDAPGLLERDVGAEPFDVVGSGDAVVQGKGRVPGSGDHPVGPQFVGKVVSERDEGVGPAGRGGRVQGVADAPLVDFELGPVEGPRLSLHTTEQGAHEGQAALVKRAHTFQAHDRAR